MGELVPGSWCCARRLTAQTLYGTVNKISFTCTCPALAVKMSVIEKVYHIFVALNVFLDYES